MNEQLLKDRARTLFAVAESTRDPELKAAALEQHRRIAMRAIALEVQRKHTMLLTLSLLLHV